MTFKKFLKRYKDSFTPEGDFARDARKDWFFPRRGKNPEDYHSKVTSYLHNSGADRTALLIFEKLWNEHISNF